MQEYHEYAATATDVNPYAYTVVPPIGQLLDIICDNCTVGGCVRLGNRALAKQLGYKSASQIPYLLSQLACDGWISYDSASGVIMLLSDPRAEPPGDESDRSIRSIDQRSLEKIDSAETALIDPIDRDLGQQDAEELSDQIDRSAPQRMEDSCLAAAESDSESAAARYKIPCAAEPISAIDRPDFRSVLLSELGAGPAIIADALRARPDLTPEQIRASWAHFEPRIKAGLCTAGAFFTAIRRGQLHTPPPDPDRPLDPAAYAQQPGFALGSDLPSPDQPESIRDRAERLLPPPTAETLKAHTRDWMFLQGRLGASDTDQEALAALDAYRKAVRR